VRQAQRQICCEHLGQRYINCVETFAFRNAWRTLIFRPRERFNVGNGVSSRFQGACFRGLCVSVLLLIPISPRAQTNLDGKLRVILSDSERAWKQKHPVVYWGVDPHWPPFSSFDKQGRIAGIDVEIVNLIAARTGLNIQVVRTPTWSETLRKAAAGEVDFVGGIARTDERERLLGLRFTEVFCNFPTAIVTGKEMPFLTSLKDLEGRRIAVPLGYAVTEELQKRYPNARLAITQNEEQSMLMVAGNKADATVLNLASASYVVHMRGLTNLKISGFSDLDFFLSLAVRKDAPELRSILEKGLASIDPREKETIYAGYILPETRSEIDWKAWRLTAIYSILAGAGALTIALCWNRSLARQIRQRKAAESALLQTQDELKTRARELDSRSAEMHALNEQLIRTNKDLESFSYSVSHDLKSPLRRLQGFAGLLKKEATNRLDADARNYLDVIQGETHRMSELIDALLALARIGQAQLRLAPVKLDELVREMIAEVSPETQGREIVWEIQPLPEMQCDRALIKQVVANLIDNAIKFTRRRAPARIEIGVLPRKPGDEEVVFYVRDNGAGFDMSFADKLFETFHRLHRYDQYEGSGIGLANVRRIVQKHGGRVWAEGEVEKGATFYFSLIGEKR